MSLTNLVSQEEELFGDKLIDVKERVLIVTGGGDGMGRATGEYWAQMGGNPVFVARSKDKIEAATEEAGKYGVDPSAIVCDVSKQEDVDRVISETMRKYGRIDLLVNYAGNTRAYELLSEKPVHELTDEEVFSVLMVDFMGSFRMSRAVLPTMMKKKSGIIINISSTPTVLSLPGDAVYKFAKSANQGLTNAISTEKIYEGIKSYVLAFGDVLNKTTWDSYKTMEKKMEAINYGWLLSKDVAKLVFLVYTGKLTKKYDLKSNSYSKLANGDIVVIDAKTAPKLFEVAGEKFEPIKAKTIEEFEKLIQ